MADLGRTLWLALPVILAGLLHVAVIRLGVLARLGRTPLDGGLSLRGRRLLGANKTLRGPVVMVPATALLCQVQAVLGPPGWSLIDFGRVPALAVGALMGLGYIVGELPNSLVKRQLGIGPGAAARGARGALFWVIDQVDSFAGVVVFLALLWPPPGFVLAGLLLICLVVHPAVAWLMVRLGLKDRVG